MDPEYLLSHPTEEPTGLRNQIRSVVEQQRANLTNPSACTWLPYPSLGASLPDMFARGQDRTFNFVGRPQLANLLGQITATGKHLHQRWVGTIGYGKSHLLAAAACCLLADGWHVVYISDSAELGGRNNEGAFDVLQEAMLVAFAGNESDMVAIANCGSISELQAWCKSLKPVQSDRLIFLLDEAHAIMGEAEPSWVSSLLYHRRVVRVVSLRDTPDVQPLIVSHTETVATFFGGLSEKVGQFAVLNEGCLLRWRDIQLLV